jgi:hypothetical protein
MRTRNLEIPGSLISFAPRNDSELAQPPADLGLDPASSIIERYYGSGDTCLTKSGQAIVKLIVKGIAENHSLPFKQILR